MSLKEELLREREDAIKKLEAINLLLEAYGEYNREQDNFRFKLRNRSELSASSVKLNGVYIEVKNLFKIGGYSHSLVKGQIYAVEKVKDGGLAIRDGVGKLRWFTDKNIIKENFKFIK